MAAQAKPTWFSERSEEDQRVIEQFVSSQSSEPIENVIEKLQQEFKITKNEANELTEYFTPSVTFTDTDGCVVRFVKKDNTIEQWVGSKKEKNISNLYVNSASGQYRNSEEGFGFILPIEINSVLNDLQILFTRTPNLNLNIGEENQDFVPSTSNITTGQRDSGLFPALPISQEAQQAVKRIFSWLFSSKSTINPYLLDVQSDDDDEKSASTGEEHNHFFPEEDEYFSDCITDINAHEWHPVDFNTYEQHVFDQKNKLKLLKKTAEFFLLVHKNLVDENVVVETSIPEQDLWKKNTKKRVDIFGKNNVDEITKSIKECHIIWANHQRFLKQTRIVVEEDQARDKQIQMADVNLGQKNFKVGKISVINPVNFFSLGKLSFELEMWDESLRQPTPGRSLMEATKDFEDVMNEFEFGSHQYSEILQISKLVEAEKMHNLCLSEYINTKRINLSDCRKKGEPERISWEEVSQTVGGLSGKIKNSLTESFKGVEYVLNAHPKIQEKLSNENPRIHHIMTPTVWLHTLCYLFNQRLQNWWILSTTATTWLSGRRKKAVEQRGFVRIEVEKLAERVADECKEVKTIVENLRQRICALRVFEDMYDQGPVE